MIDTPPGEAPERATPDQILQFLTTEHFTLQTAKSATVAEANGRASLFVGAVSSAVVALAFIGQVSQMGDAFFLFGVVLFPSLLFLGVVTFDRVVQTAIENMIHSRGINRIRHYYAEIAPGAARYFIHSMHDDVPGVLTGMGISPTSSRWQHFVTMAGMISVINSTLAGVFAGLAARVALAPPIYVAAVVGAVVFALGVLAHWRLQQARYADIEARLATLFPSPET